MSLSTRTVGSRTFLFISWNLMSIMVLLIFFIHIGLVLLIGLLKILINHFITTNTTTTSDLMTKITLTCSALPAPPSASVACQQDHRHHRRPSCRPRTSQNHHLTQLTKKPFTPSQCTSCHPLLQKISLHSALKEHDRCGGRAPCEWMLFLARERWWY